ncbi:MAG: glycosyltransferase family 2 protein [Cyclobacteriaceae bacterium]
MADQLVSIVIPLYNEVESIGELTAWIDKCLSVDQLAYEIIVVDDGSNDGSWDKIHLLTAENTRIRALKFKRNYGKSAALQCGFQSATGDVVITMDADLQDSPEEVPELVRMIREDGFDLVSGWKKKRHDPITKTVPSKLFNWVTRKISGIKLHDFNCGLKAYRSDVVKSIDIYGEMHRYIPYIAKWHGFYKIGEKVVAHQARKYGTTKFGIERFINGFLDLMSITFVTKFKKRPMHFFGSFGLLTFFSGGIITTYLIAEKVYKQYYKLAVRDIVDQPLFFLALVALIVGVQLFLAGFIAEMMTQNQNRINDYLITESIGIDTNA